ncbi:ERC protein 2-like [Mercenaria mercenaria]|uniref:ERC protein 2-like n=1 Tax=Mercenaria mercenaria TaxID=6596 RepID=UPI00234F23A1|nr:ERC protein 2-like [Mercenaria mercenaria]
MDEKQRSILDRNQWLLVGNIVMTEDFFQVLRAENVLPDTMIRDVQAKTTQYERNTKLLETLRLRGGDVYRKFRHVLYLTGHLLLADHLYGEEIETKLLRADEVFGKFPKIFNHVSDDTKSKLLKYLETKVKERAITNAWLTSGQERSEVLEAKKIHYDAEKDYRIKLETKTRKMTQLKDELSRLKEEIKSKDEEIVCLKREIVDMQRRFKQDLAKQTRFNAANNHSIIQLRERFENFNERVKTVNIAIRQFLETEHDDIQEDADNIKISVLERNVRKLIQLARTNIENTSSSISEKEAVLNLLRTSTRHKQHTLSEIVQQYVEKQERAKMTLANELEQLLTAVRGPKSKLTYKTKTDLKFLKTQMSILREEVEHMKKKIEWKDAQISDLIKEKSCTVDQDHDHIPQNPSSRYVTFPRLSVSSLQRDSPDSSKEIERVYQQFDRFNKEACSPPPNHSRRRRGSLAEVDLERGRSPSPVHSNRRNTRLETSDLDLFGSSVQFRRSVTDIGSTSLQSLSSFSSSSIDKASTPRHTSDMNDKIKLDLKRRRESRPEPEAEYVREGRRPSLAELITIYESANDENQEENATNKKLPVLQES